MLNAGFLRGAGPGRGRCGPGFSSSICSIVSWSLRVMSLGTQLTQCIAPGLGDECSCRGRRPWAPLFQCSAEWAGQNATRLVYVCGCF